MLLAGALIISRPLIRSSGKFLGAVFYPVI